MKPKRRAIRFAHEWPIVTKNQPDIADLKQEALIELEMGAYQKGYRILQTIFAVEHGKNPKLHAQVTAVKI